MWLGAVAISKSTTRYSKFVIKLSLYFVYLILNATAPIIKRFSFKVLRDRIKTCGTVFLKTDIKNLLYKTC